MKKQYLSLLTRWCDGIMKNQLTNTGIDGLDGGIYCTSCGGIHGRSPDAVYPLLCVAKATGEKKYIDSAKALFDWGEQLLTEEGSYYNDHNSAWTGITVFMSMSVYEALHNHGDLLDEATYKKWDDRLRVMAEWLYKYLNPAHTTTNVNYLATNAGAMAALGNFYKKENYLTRAKELADLCFSLITENGFLMGEGKPMDHITPRGCRAVDIGYNVEESLPMLALYAREMKDDKALATVMNMLKTHLQFMLPDGAWDNSFGTRTFKWTYWGSRTSDGFGEACAAVGDLDPVIAKAAWLNFQLQEKCTHDDLLYGGPHYKIHGEKPCMHHTICHAKALAALVDSDIPVPDDSVTLPPAPVCKHYPEIDTYKIHLGGFYSTVTAYDFDYMSGGHASGGTLTLLWHEKVGPIVASTMTDYSMHESHNQQLTLKPLSHSRLTPNFQFKKDKTLLSDMYDFSSTVFGKKNDESVEIIARATLCDIAHKYNANNATGVDKKFNFTAEKFAFSATINGTEAENVRFVLPLIGLTKDGYTYENGVFSYMANGNKVTLKTDNKIANIRPIFFLAAGFEAWELTFEPNSENKIALEIVI